MPLPRTDRHSWKIHLARLAGPPGDGVVFWRWLAEQLFPDWSGGLAGSSVSLRPSPRSCRSLPFLRSRSLPSRHVRFFLSLSLSFLSFVSVLSRQSIRLETGSWSELSIRGKPRDVHVAPGSRNASTNEEEPKRILFH